LVIGLRSLLFHLASALVSLAFLPLFPLVLGPRWLVWVILRRYVHIQLWLLQAICGLSYRLVGSENIPDGPVILAARHEAMWETLFLPLVFDLPAVILKQEILHYPLAGPIARKLGFIGVDRSGSPDGAKRTFDQARAVARGGRSILIFPNGTRDPARRFRVQKGVAVLYRALKLPVVPVVLDSGDYWIYRRWLRRPGVITVRVLPSIEPGLRTDALLSALEGEMARSA